MQTGRPDPEAVLGQAARVRRLARELVFDGHLAADVSQEVLLVALERAPRDPRSLSGWLAALVRNVARKAWRTDDRREARERRSVREDRAVPSPAEILEREELRRRLVAHVLALEEPLREVLVLRHLEDLPPRAIARRLGVPVETVRTRLKRGHELLRGRLDRESGGDRGVWALALVRGLDVPASTLGIGSALAGAALGAGSVTGVAMGIVGKTALAAGAIVLAVLGFVRTGDERQPPREEPGVAGPAELVASAPIAPATVPPAQQQRAAVPAAGAPPGAEPLGAETQTTGALLVRATWHDGTPAAEVGVTIHASGAEDFYADARDVTTGADGTCLVDAVPAGRVAAWLDRGLDGVTAVIEPGGLAEVELAIPRGYDVSGRVVRADGAPVAGAELFLSTLGAAATSYRMVARTDAAGCFEVRSIQGLGWLAARASGYAPSGAYTLLSGSGATLEVQLTLPGPGGAVAGVVTDVAGAPVEGAQLVIGAESFTGGADVPEGVQAMKLAGRTAATDAEGRFDAAGLAPGTQPVLVRARGLAPWRGEVEVVEGGTASLAVVLLPEAWVAGVVTDAAGQPLSGVQVHTVDDGFLGRVTASHVDGAFRLRGLPAGEVALVAEGEEHGKATTTVLAVNGAEVAWDPVLDAGLTLRGRIELPGADVTLLSVRCERFAPGEEVLMRAARPDAAGVFTITGLADVGYRIEVSQPGDGYSFPLAIREDVTPSLDELVIAIDPAELPSVRLAGRVVDAQGNAVAGVTVSPSWVSNPAVHNAPLFTTDEDGGFDMGPYPPGTWAVHLRIEGGPRLRLDPVELTAGATHDFGDVVFQ